MSKRVGIIGGTGIYTLPGIRELHEEHCQTPFGDVVLHVGNLAGASVAFLTRHGERHNLAPGDINVRANIWAMREFGAEQVVATACCGSMNPDYVVGDFVLLDQFLEFTKNRPARFFENDPTKPLLHIDYTDPYCRTIGACVKRAAESAGLQVKEGATYCCTQGPRFETRAEIRMMRILGGDLVGHTNYPEVVLAREAGLCYAAIAIVSNMAAGMLDQPITAEECKTVMSQRFEALQRLLEGTVAMLPEGGDCACRHAADKAML